MRLREFTKLTEASGAKTCPNCKGKGHFADDGEPMDDDYCTMCNGEGAVDTRGARECTNCDGQGHFADDGEPMDDDYCNDCAGTGKVGKNGLPMYNDQLTEISKGATWTQDDVEEFKGKLKDPQAVEFESIVARIEEAIKGYSFESGINQEMGNGWIRMSLNQENIDRNMNDNDAANATVRAHGRIISTISGIINQSANWTRGRWSASAAGTMITVEPKQ